MDNFNNEGFAIAPQAECVNGLKPTFYAEDSDANGAHAARRDDQLHAAAAGGRRTRRPRRRRSRRRRRRRRRPRPRRTVDRTAPSLKLALKVTKSGTYDVRKTGKFAVAVTLGERADLTISATARKNAKAKARTILKATTRKGVAAGKPTLKLSLSQQGAQGAAQGRDPDADRGRARRRGQRHDDEGLREGQVGRIARGRCATHQQHTRWAGAESAVSPRGVASAPLVTTFRREAP